MHITTMVTHGKVNPVCSETLVLLPSRNFLQKTKAKHIYDLLLETCPGTGAALVWMHGVTATIRTRAVGRRPHVQRCTRNSPTSLKFNVATMAPSNI